MMFIVPTVLPTREVWKILEPLLKADGGNPSGGLKVIAVGPLGGQIVGYYGPKHKPIYLGSGRARALLAAMGAAQAKQGSPPAELGEDAVEWLKTLGFLALHDGNAIVVNPETGAELLNAFGVKPSAKGVKVWRMPLKDLKAHIGKPLVPSQAEEAAWAAKVAAPDPFPDLATLKEIPAGSAAGSHGNRLFQSPDGKKWLFKHGNAAIARAEEAASRIGLLMLGEGKVQAAKYVQLAGTDGVLLSWLSGESIEGSAYHKPSDQVIKENFEQLVQHEVLDWLISNHDSHAGNFLIEDGQVRAIDKGQSWRFLGKDQLSATYKPNASPPVYLRMWQLFKEGAIKADPVASARKAFEAIEKITPEHFENIIGPYALTRAKEKGESAAQVTSMMLSRFQNAKADWNTFLSSVTGKKVDIDAPAVKEAPTKLVEPEQPKQTVAAVEPPVVKPTIGWPITKGKLTVHSPGVPPPADVKWPEGYPGEGFNLTLDYKGQQYNVSFSAMGNPLKFAVMVKYPDGQWKIFDSANKASDSLYLFHHGLDLNMTGTEKKAKGISYPAGKAFGFKAFEAELAQVFGQPPAVAQTVTELEKPKEPEPAPTPEAPPLPPVKLSPEPITTTLGSLVGEGDTPAVNTSNWEWFKENHIDALLPGTHLMFSFHGDEVHAVKLSVPGEWYFKEGPASGLVPLADMVAHADEKAVIVAYPLSGSEVEEKKKKTQAAAVVQPVAEAGTKQFDASTLTPGLVANILDEQPKGTEFKVGFAVWDKVSPTQYVNSEGETMSTVETAANMVQLSANAGKPVVYTTPPALPLPSIVDSPETFDEAMEIVKQFPVGTQLKHSPSNDMYTLTDSGWDEATAGGTVVDSLNTVSMAKVLMGNFFTVTPPKEAPASVVKEVPKSTISHDGKFKLGKATLVMQPQHLPASAAEQMEKAFTAAQQWASTQANDGAGHTLGEKPPTWAPWVPPPGVFVEGEHGGHKYWLAVTCAGFTANGPGPSVRFSVIDEAGVVHSSNYLNGAKAALKAVKNAVVNISGLSALDGPELRKVFNLDSLVFAPGETWNTVNTNGGAKVAPAKAPDKLTPAEKVETVTTTMPAALALKKLLPNVEIATDGVVTLKAQDGDQESAGKVLSGILKALGLKQVAPMLTLPTGASAVVVKTDLTKDVVINTDGLTAASLSSPPGADNWETMPEGMPKVLSAQFPASQMTLWLSQAPSGTKLQFSKVTYTKKADGSWSGTEGGVPNAYAAILISAMQAGGGAIPVFPPTDAPPKVKAPAKPKIPEKTPEQLAKEKKAKEVAEWGKKYPPVNDSSTRLLLSYVQAHVGSMLVRQDGEHVLVLAGDPKVDAFFSGVKGATKVSDSPIGAVWRVRAEDAADDLPGKPASMVKGPDGAMWPSGTTFETVVIKHSFKERLQAQPGFYKFAEHKTDPTKLVIKVKGTGPEQASKLSQWDTTYHLGLGPIQVGGSNTLASVSKAKLDETYSTEEELKVTKPLPPPTFLSLPLPAVGGLVQDGAPGTVNTADLSVLETLAPARTGHAVRLGKYGVFYNNQVYVRKVVSNGGQPYYEVYGDLHTIPNVAQMKLAKGVLSIPSTSGKLVKGYHYHLQNFDVESGNQKETGEGQRKYSALVGATEGGANVRLIQETNKPAMNGAFSIRLPVGVDVQKELANAFGLMGLDVGAAMAEPTADDTRALMKFQVARSLKGWVNGPELRAMTEPALDKVIAAEKGEAKLESAMLQQVLNGKQVTVVPGQEEKARQDGVRFIYSTHSGIGGVLARLIEGGTMTSNKRKILNGIEARQSSLDSDEHVGGSAVSFTRFGNIGVGSAAWGNVNSEGPKLIFHPRVLNRTDWYAHAHDAYGNHNCHNPQDKSFNFTNSDNEVDFEDGVSGKDLAGIVVNTAEDKEKLISQLQAEGLTEFNSIPLDKFILAHSGRSRKIIAEGLFGLQPGNLP